METMTQAEAEAAYGEFLEVSDEPEELSIEHWLEWEGIVIR